MPTKMRPVFFAIWEPLRNLVSLPISTRKAGLSPHGAPSHDHDFELVTPDVRAPLDSWSLHLRYYAVLSKRSFQSGPFEKRHAVAAFATDSAYHSKAEFRVAC